MRDRTGLIHPRGKVRRRDEVAFLFKARVAETTCWQTVVATCHNVKRRRKVPIPSNWEASMAASRLPRDIEARTRELQEHVELESAFLGVPKRVLPQRANGRLVPGAVIALVAIGSPNVVILCAPVTDEEWYCHKGEDTFGVDGLFVADTNCEAECLCASTIGRVDCLLERARIHNDAFSIVVATAAFRAAKDRARKNRTRISADALGDYFEVDPFGWAPADGRQSRARPWTRWAWRASDEWEHQICVQHQNHALDRGVLVPEAVRRLVEVSRTQAAVPENALESPAMEEMRAAVVRALIRKDECAAKELTRNLVNAGAELDFTTKDGRTLLMVAAEVGLRGVTQLLWESGASVNAEGSDGRAALHCATGRGNVAIMRDFLAAGADPHLSSVSGKTPSSDARYYCPSALIDDVRRVLCEYGFVEYPCEKRLWELRRLRDLAAQRWWDALNADLMPMV